MKTKKSTMEMAVLISMILILAGAAYAIDCQFSESCSGSFTFDPLGGAHLSGMPASNFCCDVGDAVMSPVFDSGYGASSVLFWRLPDGSVTINKISDPPVGATPVFLNGDENIAVLYYAAPKNAGDPCPPYYDCVASMDDVDAADVSDCSEHPLRICVTEYPITAEKTFPIIVGRTGPLSLTTQDFSCGVSDGVCPDLFEQSDGTAIDCGGVDGPDDPDCFEVCDDGVDNNGDGNLDCADPVCCANPACWDDYAADPDGEAAFGGICCADGWDNDQNSATDYVDLNCLSSLPVPTGSFTEITQPASNQNFRLMALEFTDESDPYYPSVDWTFAIESTSGCAAGYPDVSLPAGAQTVTPGDTIDLGDLALVAHDVDCEVTISAVSSSSTVYGLYSLTYLPTAICPNCEVTEVPAVTQPITLYSASQSDAQAAYESAESAVDSLDQRCSASACSGEVSTKLAEAKNHLFFAAEYLGLCSPGDISCRYAQYYAQEAESLIQGS